MRVIVVGAGIAGLSIGWRLAQAGAETIVIERAQPGRGATWASGGMLAPTLETGHAPEAEVAFARKSMDLWPGFAEELEAVSGRRLGYRRDGALVVAQSEEEAEPLKAAAAAAGVNFIPPEEARALVPALNPDILGALWAPGEAQVDNRAVGDVLAMAFLRAGGNLQTNEAVVRLETLDGGTIAVRTAFKTYEGDAVILAAGAWTGEIEGLPPEAVPPVRPVKGEMIALQAPAGAALPVPFVWGNHFYLIPRDDRLFVGATATESGFDTALTADAETFLFSRACGLMPGLADWEICEHWAGLRPGSPDGLPILGASTVENVYVASGQFRNGILLAPAIAEAMRSIVLEGRPPPEIAAFTPSRFRDDTVPATGSPLQ